MIDACTKVANWRHHIRDIDKSKHVLIEVGGSVAASLHFHAGNKDTAEDILAKLESSRSHARQITESTASSTSQAEYQADPEPEPEPKPARLRATHASPTFDHQWRQQSE